MLGEIVETITAAGIERNALIFVGRSLGRPAFDESYLYSAARPRT